MKLRFLGDGDSRETTAYGHTFTEGEWQDEADTALTADQLKKLGGNPAFEVQGAVKAKPVAGPKPEAEIPANWTDLPFMTKRALALEFGADLPKKAAKAAVDGAIQAEVDRRAAVAKALEDGEGDEA